MYRKCENRFYRKKNRWTGQFIRSIRRLLEHEQWKKSNRQAQFHNWIDFKPLLLTIIGVRHCIAFECRFSSVYLIILSEWRTYFPYSYHLFTSHLSRFLRSVLCMVTRLEACLFKPADNKIDLVYLEHTHSVQNTNSWLYEIKRVIGEYPVKFCESLIYFKKVLSGETIFPKKSTNTSRNGFPKLRKDSTQSNIKNSYLSL